MLARHCELNNWTLKSLRAVLEQIQEDFDNPRAPEYAVEVRHSGATFVRIRHADGDSVARPLPPADRQVFEAQLLNVAELDRGLLSALETALTMTATLEDVREDLISYLLGEDEEESGRFEGFVEYALVAIGDAFAGLQALYRVCTGRDELVYHRLR